MSETWKTAIFWFVFITVSSWLLRRFYFSKGAVPLERLRLAAFIIELVTIGLFFFPWLPKLHGGFSGWQMIVQGNVGVVTLFFLLLGSIALFLTKNLKLLKLGAALHITATVLIFVVMIQALSGTIQLAFRDIAPIIAALFMLINTVVVLLLWHILQKRDKLKIEKD
ncbi:MAG: hypothetical protein Q7S62_00670 [bacterium]|nr:hypothetical protein [bacterium]